MEKENMSKLRVVSDSLYWLTAFTDAVSSLILLRLGFAESNGLYAFLGNYEFWVLYAAVSVVYFGLIKAFQHHFMHHKCSVVSYVALFSWALCHAVCTFNNIGQVIS